MTAVALDCEVWWARRELFRAGLVGSLDANERLRLDALVHAADRQRFVLGCAIAREVLGARYGLAPEDVRLDRACGECGRPHGKVRDGVGDPPVQMSVSHAGDHVVVAFCRDAAVGVDVERIDGGAVPAGVSRHVLADCEAGVLESLAPSARSAALVTYWARKEALVKATGAGLRATLTDIVVSAPGQPARLVRSGLDGPMQLLDLASRPGYAAALAVMATGPVTIRERDARSLLAR